MADDRNIVQRGLSALNPIPRFQNFGNRVVNHPVQTGLETAANAIPFVGPILSRLLRSHNDRSNNRETNTAMIDQITSQNEELSNQIFPPNGQGQSPGMGGMAGQGPSMGSAGPAGGMAGITSPWEGQQSQQSPLLQMLGINTDYSGGGNAGPVTTAGGSTGANLLNMIHNTNSRPITGAATSLGSNGATVGTATMSDVESMLSAGIGRSGAGANLTPGREMSEMRDAQRNAGNKRAPGQSVRDFLMQ